MPPTGDLAHNPGMCPDWESNQRPFGSQASTQSTEPHQPGYNTYIFIATNVQYLVIQLLITVLKLKNFAHYSRIMEQTHFRSFRI